MLTVHHLGISQSERIVWLCEELELEYELRRYERIDGKGLAPPEYKHLHPMGTAPVITDGDMILGESGAICEYICTRYGNGKLVPAADSTDLAGHLFWFHWCNGTFMAALMAQSVLKLAKAEPDNRGAAYLTERIGMAWQMIEARLTEARFFGGNELTTADIMMVFSLTTGRIFRGTSIEAYPAVQRYLADIGKRPAYQRAMAKAEPGFQPGLN
jgi:glutathione S-transferase